MGYPIKVAARRSGLSPHVIRVWEKRYGAAQPGRTATNRRLYTDADIERLRLLRLATEAGHSIGQIAALPTAAVRTLVATDEQPIRHAIVEPAASGRAAGSGPADAGDGVGLAAVPQEPVNGSRHAGGVSPALRPGGDRPEEELESAMPAAALATPGAPNSPSSFIEAALVAVQRFDTPALEAVLAQASVHHSPLRLLEDVIQPLMARIGDMWHQGILRIADEHMAAAAVRSFVDSLRSAFAGSSTASHLIVTTPAGQLHEIGALAVCVLAGREGWRATYLGPNLPAAEIARAVHQSPARAVALSLGYPDDDPHLPGELVRLRQCLPAETALLVGGPTACRHEELLTRLGSVCLPSLGALAGALEQLRTPARSGETYDA